MYARSYSPGELDRIKDSYLADPARDNRSAIYDQTWNDMDMDRVFARIDSCSSLAGQERLYAILREPFSDETEIKRRDSLIRYFDENRNLADEYKKKLGDIGSNIKQPAGVTIAQLEGLAGQGNALHIICALLGLVSIAMIFISPSAGLLIFLAVLILNITTYFRRKGEIGEYLACFSYMIRSYNAAKAMLSVKDNEELSYRKQLRKAVGELRGVVRGSFLVTGGRGLTGSVINMVLDYLRIFFHLDLIKFNLMQKKVTEHREDIELMSKTLGEIDAFIAVAAYRRSLPFWCVPGYVKDIRLKGRSICHPLLEDPVSADIDASEKGILVTGSNASGKSTFLRSVALAGILGQSIGTVYAESFCTAGFHIVSSMAVADDIASGSSYYMAEIKALKHVLDSCSSGEPVLCFVDEVLKGTNTIERIAASSEILKSLVRDNVICFAATHDRELTDMLSEYFVNYHFVEDISNDDVRFSYKLMTGPAVSRNAIKLLGIMGYDESITDSAEERAGRFEESGVWERI